MIGGFLVFLVFSMFYSFFSVYSYLCCVELSTCPFYCGIQVTQKTNYHLMQLLRIIKVFVLFFLILTSKPKHPVKILDCYVEGHSNTMSQRMLKN